MPLYLLNGKLLVKDGKLTNNSSCCCGGCPECTGSTCCGTDYPRQIGECCEGIWRIPSEGTCCGGVWYPVGVAGECCCDVWYTGQGECCGGKWYTSSGDCCGGITWYPESPSELPPEPNQCPGIMQHCPENTSFFKWTAPNGYPCCGCFPEEMPSPFSDPPGQMVPSETILPAYCCDPCGSSGQLHLGLDPSSLYRCKGVCCVDDTSLDQYGNIVFFSDCSQLYEDQCRSYLAAYPYGLGHPTYPNAQDYLWLPNSVELCCTSNTCVSECCINGNLLEEATFTISGEVIAGKVWTINLVDDSFSYEAVDGDTIENVAIKLQQKFPWPLYPRNPPGITYYANRLGNNLIVLGPAASSGTISVSGTSYGPISSKILTVTSRICSYFKGIRKTEENCPCRQGQRCCETKTSSGQLLTFNKPSNLSGTVRVTVTGTTTSPILVHGTLLGADSSPTKKCPFTHTFLLCFGTFNIEPIPCGYSFHNIDVEVCYEEESTLTETFNFSGCNDLTIKLGSCPDQCITTLTYNKNGHTSNSNISLTGTGIIEANGTGPLILTSNVIITASCTEKLILTGTNTDLNEINRIIDSSTNIEKLSIVEKQGTGLWRLNGTFPFSNYNQFKLLQGTVRVAKSVDSTFNSVLGNFSRHMILGDDSPVASGSAILLLETNTYFDKEIRIPPGSDQTVVIGSVGNGMANIGEFSTLCFIGIGRHIILQASDDSVAHFRLVWIDINQLPLNDLDYNTPGPAVTFTIGSNNNAGTVYLSDDSRIRPEAIAVNIVNGTLKLYSFTLIPRRTATGYVHPNSPIVTLGSSTHSAHIDNRNLFDGDSEQELSNLNFVGNGNTIYNGIISFWNDTPLIAPIVPITVNGTNHEILSAVNLYSDIEFSGNGNLLISGDISEGIDIEGLAPSNGSKKIIKNGTGTLKLSGNNTYPGGTEINEGTIQVMSINALGTETITINSGGTLDKNGFSIANNIINNGGTIIP